MTGPILKIVRVEKTVNGAVGILLIDGLIHCYTLEPDPTDEHFYIPAGVYPYRRFHGAKHPDTFEVVVKGHTALLFHAGNTEDNTEGCLLMGYEVGFSNTRRNITPGTSKVAFSDFMRKMGKAQSGIIQVEDHY